MPVEVESSCLEHFANLIALVEGARAITFWTSSCGIGCPVLIVDRVVRQDLRIERPVLIELRRELDEVARHVGARQRRIGLRRKHAVKRMAELVEHRRHVVPADQRRLAGRRLGEVLDVEDDRAWCRAGATG